MPNPTTNTPHHSDQLSDTIIFVCAMNTCRSMVGQIVFNYIKENTKLALRAESAGIWAGEGQPCDSIMKDIAAKRGYDLSACRSTPLETLNSADYARVFIFEQAHFEAVKQWMGSANKPEYIMSYSSYFTNQEVLMQAHDNITNTYTHILDLIEDGCLGLYKQLIAKRDNDF